MPRLPPLRSLWATRRRAAVSAATAVVVTAAVGWLAFGYFGIQGLVFDDKVNEAAPFAAATTASGATATTVTSGGAATTGASGGAATSGASGGAATTGASGPRTTFTSTFVSRAHTTTGQAIVLTDGTTRFLRLVDLATDNGPDVHVYLSAGVDARTSDGRLDDDFVSLGKLKGNIGSQNYEIPAGVDLTRYRTVVLWCKRFTVAFGASDLAATPAT